MHPWFHAKLVQKILNVLHSRFQTKCPRVESDKKKKSLRERSEELRCPYCDIIQSNKSSLSYHITTVHYPQNLDLYENTDQSVVPKQRKTSEEGIEVVTLDENDSPEISNKKSTDDLSFKSGKSLVETDFSVKLLGEKSEELRCPYCDKIQTNKSSLSYHISTVHYFQNPFLNENTNPSSAQSDNKFKEVMGLPKKHLIEANERNNWTYECFICHENFATYDNFKKHISSEHGVTLMSKEEKPVPKPNNQNEDHIRNSISTNDISKILEVDEIPSSHSRGINIRVTNSDALKLFSKSPKKPESAAEKMTAIIPYIKQKPILHKRSKINFTMEDLKGGLISESFFHPLRNLCQI